MLAAAARERDWSSMGWTGAEIATATGAAAGAAVRPAVVDTVCTDSRRAGPGALFVALRGARHDAHAFVATALHAGAAAALVDHVPDGVDAARTFVVIDTLRALGDLAAFTRRRWGGRVVGITGSNGKTTTKEMVAAIAAAAYGPGSVARGRVEGRSRVLKTYENLNNLIGLPLTVLGLAGDEALAVLEMGMNAPGEIARLTEIAAPDIGVITNIGPAHLEGLGSVAGVAAAKGELFTGMGADATIVVNMDDEWVARVAAPFRGRRVEFGVGREVDASAIVDRGFAGIGFRLRVGNRHAAVTLRMAGRHNVQNALAAAATAHALGIDLDAISAGLGAAELPKMRMQVVRLANGVTVVNDAYNANPASAMAALETLARSDGRTIAVLGEMRELGPESAALHREVGAHAAVCGIWWLLAVGPQAEDLAAGARAGGGIEVTVCADAAEAAHRIVARWRSGDAVLVKGSRGADTEEGVRRYGARMAEVVARLEEAGGGRS